MSAILESYIDVPNGEEPVGVFFSNMALARAEKQLDKSIFQISQGFQDNTTTLNDVAVLLQVGMEAYRKRNHIKGKPVSLAKAFSVLEEVGFAGVAGVVFVGVAEVLGYSSDEEEGHDGDDTDPN